jgi:hypothetical protein
MTAIHAHQTSPEVAAAAVTTTTKTTTISPQPFHYYEVINKVHLLRSIVNTGK